MMIPLPRLSFDGIIDYLALAGGIAIGFAVFTQPMAQLENAFRKNGGA
tara:strand:+ start:577 stop:720 length:144 start_codon:yes stop_codon:yes gene_type:complete